MLRHVRPVALAFMLFAAAPATAAEIKVLAYNAVNIPARELAAAFTRETGHQVTFTFGSPAPVNERLNAGEPFDLVIAATQAAQARDALWRTRRPLVRVGIGLAVREGVTLDLSTVDSTRQALLAARSLTLSDSSTGGLSGPNALKVLANLSQRPIPALPNVPSFAAETGLQDFDIMVWLGFVAPAGTPAEIVAKLNREIVRVLALPEVKERLAAIGLDAADPRSPEAFAAYIRSETERWTRVIKASGFKAE